MWAIPYDEEERLELELLIDDGISIMSSRDKYLPNPDKDFARCMSHILSQLYSTVNCPITITKGDKKSVITGGVLILNINEYACLDDLMSRLKEHLIYKYSNGFDGDYREEDLMRDVDFINSINYRGFSLKHMEINIESEEY